MPCWVRVPATTPLPHWVQAPGERTPTCRTPRCRARAAAGDLDAGAPVHGGGRGRAVRSGGRAGRPGRPGGRVERVLLIDGGVRSVAVRQLAPSVFGCPVLVPPPGELRRRRRGPAGGVGAQRWRGAPRLGAPANGAGRRPAGQRRAPHLGVAFTHAGHRVSVERLGRRPGIVGRVNPKNPPRKSERVRCPAPHLRPSPAA